LARLYFWQTDALTHYEFEQLAINGWAASSQVTVEWIGMPLIKAPLSPDLSLFQRDADLEVKYGLPAVVRFCRSCVISNQRPNSAVEYAHTRESRKQTIIIDGEGICDACRVAELKKRMRKD